MHQILLIEDEAGIAQMISVQLQLVGFRVTTAADIHSALKAEHLQKAEAIILDWMLPDGAGPKIIPQIRKQTSAPLQYRDGDI